MIRLVFALVMSVFALVMMFSFSSRAENAVPDDTIYDQVRIRIAADRVVGGGNIQVAVTNGVVELTGTVKAEKLKVQAEKVVKKVKGVKSVDNKLRVAPV